MDPVTIAIAATAVASVLKSEKVRKIVSDIFRHPTKRSVVLTVGSDTLLVEGSSSEETQRLIADLLKQQAMSSTPSEKASEETAIEADSGSGEGATDER